MRYSTSIALLVAPLAALAAPARFLGKRSDTDILVFKFADVLEQFESQFYQAALSKFKDTDFTSAGFAQPQVAIEQFTSIQNDEATHSTVLQAALKTFGAEPITNCQFNFDPALTDVATMAATARIVELLGVSAYLGAATLLDDSVLLTSAGSILTVEARHQTVLNVLSGSGSAIPQSFDVPFSPSEVLAVAGPFISGCDTGIKPNVPLSITNTGAINIGTKLEFSSSALDGKSNLFCQMLVGGAPFTISLPIDNCVVPTGVNGPVALFITSDDTPLINNLRDRATDKTVAGPNFIFVDAKPQQLSQLSRSSSVVSSSSSNSNSNSGSSSSNSGESVSTTTISPAEASAIIAGATGTASGSSPAASPVGNAAAAPPVSSSPDLTTGPSQDGKIQVDGWQNLLPN